MWKQIEDSGYYINKEGKIKGKRVSYLKTRRDKDGYEIVTLWVKSKQLTCKVHRLVASAFIPNPLDKPQINHINEIKSDNRVENLEWCTPKENLIHSNNLYSDSFKEGRDKYHNSNKIKEKGSILGNKFKYKNLKQYQSEED